jgi:signal transduction histidine kinase
VPAAAPEGLQQLDEAPVSAAAAGLARRILSFRDPVAAACELVAQLLLASDEVEMVVLALTLTPPDDQAGWARLGDRVWLREWVEPGSPCRSAPGGEGPEGALTMPYVSQWARDEIVAVPDRDRLPAAGARDREELEACGTAALVTCSLQRGEVMYGSFSLARSTPGEWSAGLLADYRLVVSALSALLGHEHDRRLLLDAVAVGERARARQQQLVATVSHELRTPVSTIIGYAELLADEAEQQPPGTFAAGVARDAGQVLTAAEHLLAVVEDLLGTARVLGGEDTRVPVDVAGAVDDVLHWHRVPAARTGVTVTSTVPQGLLVLVRPAALRQVLANLIGNAVVHNRPGGTAEVSAQPMLGEGGELRLRLIVRDTGPGLSSEQLRDAFEPFVRFNPDVPGTGLGLSLARTVAERDGGSLGAESVPGEGSVFWIDLPVG